MVIAQVSSGLKKSHMPRYRKWKYLHVKLGHSKILLDQRFKRNRKPFSKIINFGVTLMGIYPSLSMCRKSFTRQIVSAMLSSNYIAATHNITHSLCTSTCTIHPALPTPLPSTTLLCTQLRNTKHSWQNGTRCRDGVKVLWCRSHLVRLVFEGSSPTCTCFHSESVFVTLYNSKSYTLYLLYGTMLLLRLFLYHALASFPGPAQLSVAY